MRVDRIRGKGFMKYAHLDVELPRSGLTLVTGKNGQGKSSLKEAVSVGFWGRTIRGKGQSGARYWKKGQLCELEVLSEEIEVARKVTERGTKSMKWQMVGAVGPEHPTSAKAKAQLEDLIPPFDVWRRTCVFSSHDAALFSLATDESRKQLLEHLLGIDRFDAALQRCRRDLSEATALEGGATRSLEVWAAQLEEKRQRLQDVERDVPEVDLDPSPEWFALRRAQEVDVPLLRELAAEAEALFRRDQVELAEVSARANEREKQLRRIDSGCCPTCGQSVGPDVLDPIRRDFEAVASELRLIQEGARARRQKLDGRVKEIEGQIWQLQRRVQDLRKIVDTADEIEERLASQRSRSSELADKVGREVEELVGRIAKEAEAHRIAQRRVTLLKVVEQVLGLRGVRAQVLGGALEGLEEVAQLHLSRMFEQDVGFKLRPYTEKKSGGITDSISMQIDGLADGEGYDGSSDGQRRRVDIALLLGLADLADAAASRDRGTVWFDEAFDALDDEGIEAVSGILADMAKVRPVVVISHKEALVASLRRSAVQRLHVADHVVRQTA